MRAIPRTAAVAAGTVALLGAATLSTTPALASDPGASTLTGPKSGSVSSAWTGSIAFPGADAAAVVGATDTHELTIKAPGKGKKAAAYFTKNSVLLDVAISWTGVYNDLDLRVFDAAGTELAISGEFLVEGEAVSIPLSAPGVYTVEVTSYVAEPGVVYDATASLSVSK